MADQLGPVRFKARFDSVLQDYQKKTGVILAEHSVAVQVQNCDSVESMIKLLLHEARAFRHFLGFDRITKAIQSTVSILYALSATASLGNAIGLVRQKTLTVCSQTLIIFHSNSHPRKQSRLPLLSYLLYVPLFRSYIGILMTSEQTRRQAANPPTTKDSSTCLTLSSTF
jgi:hypothetical protein